MRRVVALSLAGLTLAGCESNYARNDRIAQRGQRLMASAGTMTLGRPNRDVRVKRAVIVHSSGQFAAVVELRNNGTKAQVSVPLLIDVKGGDGTSVYRNDVQGLQPALQRAALVAPGRSVWWVNDQLLGVTAAHGVSARVGQGLTIARPPKVTLRDVHFETDSDGSYLTGTVENRSGVLQRDLPIFAVALAGTRVVAAGRALVTKAPPTGKPAHFRLIFVGNPKGARVQLTVAPAAPTKDPEP